MSTSKNLAALTCHHRHMMSLGMTTQAGMVSHESLPHYPAHQNSHQLDPLHNRTGSVSENACKAANFCKYTHRIALPGLSDCCIQGRDVFPVYSLGRQRAAFSKYHKARYCAASENSAWTCYLWDQNHISSSWEKNSESWRRFTVLLVQKREMQSSGLGCYDKKVVCWQNRES